MIEHSSKYLILDDYNYYSIQILKISLKFPFDSVLINFS